MVTEPSALAFYYGQCVGEALMMLHVTVHRYGEDTFCAGYDLEAVAMEFTRLVRTARNLGFYDDSDWKAEAQAAAATVA